MDEKAERNSQGGVSVSDELIIEKPQRVCMMKTLDEAGRCAKEAKLALRVDFKNPAEKADVEAFVNVWICDDPAHVPPQDEIKTFIAMNFETMCVGFNMVGRAKPVLELTEFQWRPMAELDKFVEEGKDVARKVYKQ